MDIRGERPVRFAALVFAGVLLLQALWIVSVPPFRGIDEFDHVYRAAGVSAGEWILETPADNGRGLIVSVPASVVEAAQAQCSSLKYTGRDNCYAISESVQGRVQIATAAGHYHPVYYAIVGVVAGQFEGAAYAYALRSTSALLCALGIALAAFVWTRAGSTRSERFAFLVCLTPVLVYSSAIPAPNGVEMVAGLVVWCSLLRLDKQKVVKERSTIAIAIAAACVLVTVRYLGPLWLGISVLTIIVFLGWGTLRAVVMRNKRLVAWGVALVGAATAGSAAWTIGSGFVGPQEDAIAAGTEVSLGAQPVVWLLQIVAAFPLRGDASPTTVYVLYLLVLSALLLVATIAGFARQRIALAMAIAVIVTLPVVLSLLTMDTHGVIWQGRYGLAYSVGLPLMASVMASQVTSGRGRRERPQLLVVACTMLGVAHAVALAAFVLKERDVTPSANDPAWADPSLPLVVVVSIAGWLLLSFAALAPKSMPGPGSRPEHVSAEDSEIVDVAYRCGESGRGMKPGSKTKPSG